MVTNTTHLHNNPDHTCRDCGIVLEGSGVLDSNRWSPHQPVGYPSRTVSINFKNSKYPLTLIDQLLFPTMKSISGQDPIFIDPPTQRIPAIMHLQILDGWACTYCPYATRTKSTMVRHRGEAHNSPNGYTENPGMQPTPVQAFTLGVGRRFFAVLPRPEDPRIPAGCDALLQELELLDAVLEGPLDARLLSLQNHDRERLTPWLERTGWISHLGQFPLLPLALSVSLPNIVQADTPVWMTTVLDRVGEAFTELWVSAEHAIDSDSMNSTLVLLKTFKKDSYVHQDIAPFRVPVQQATRNRYRNLWLTYTIFCCRCYLKQLSTHTTLSDKYRVIVAPHLVQLGNHEDTVNTPSEHCVDVNNLNASTK
ncbi:hypothetical protein EV426DRAFT_579172 [Tirmania nivea]|nr:hypothetical protein EV426DRAFT_579172 [Tirmania nivea]